MRRRPGESDTFSQPFKYGAEKVRLLNVFDGSPFGNALVVSPKMLSMEQKVQRWEQVWFPIVKIVKDGENDESSDICSVRLEVGLTETYNCTLTSK